MHSAISLPTNEFFFSTKSPLRSGLEHESMLNNSEDSILSQKISKQFDVCSDFQTKRRYGITEDISQ